VERERGLLRQLPVLVGLGRPDDRDAAAHATEIARHAGRKRGSATSGETSSNVTSTGMPMRIARVGRDADEVRHEPRPLGELDDRDDVRRGERENRAARGARP
jgi:hypothetical protein